MVYELPSLKAVRAFESCYRLGSYTRAAQHLNVQQPAISHQIRLLEMDLGVKLFVKKGAAMVPTEPAHGFYRTVSAALRDIERDSIRLRRQGRDQGVTLATYPGIASFWLLPRLAKLRKDAPQTVVRVTTAERDGDVPLDDVDCAILFGRGDWPGFESRLLFREIVQPVAAPKLVEELAGVTPSDLVEQGPLIHLEDRERRWQSWEDWQRTFAPETDVLDRSVVVTNHGVAIHQALQGTGVALGWRGMIDDLIASEVLTPLMDTALETESGYYLLFAPEFQETPAYAPFMAALGFPS